MSDPTPGLVTGPQTLDPRLVEQLPPPARKALAPDAPPPLKLLAAKGVVPGLKPADALLVVALLADAADLKVAEAARATLASPPAPVLEGALKADLHPLVLSALIQSKGTDEEVLPRLLGMPRITTELLEALANAASERCGEIIATNESLLLAHPTVIEKLYMNKRVRMSTADRLIELAVRNGIELGFPAFKEAAQAIQNELIAEPTEERSFDDELFDETERLAEVTQADASSEDVCEEDDEGQEQVRDKFIPLFAQIQNMTVTQKIRRAMLGNGAERMLLVRDSNRLVAEAAAKSPRMTDAEAARISASRSVSDEVLRIIAMNREFTRNYQVKLNLISNPRTPLTFTSRLIPHLRESDLRSLARSKNVPGNVVALVRQQMMRKQKR